jgi:hypothetical protein
MAHRKLHLDRDWYTRLPSNLARKTSILLMKFNANQEVPIEIPNQNAITAAKQTIF